VSSTFIYFSLNDREVGEKKKKGKKNEKGKKKKEKPT